MAMSSANHSERLTAIDCLRGLVMILMTLDHTRDFFTNAHFSPTDLSQTSPALFLTRWITHYCAPTFVFLAGLSTFLAVDKFSQISELSRFLFLRGVLLIVLQSTVEAVAWEFTGDLREINGGVLWAIGWSMIFLAGLVYLPMRWIVVIGLVMVLGHNAFDTISIKDVGDFAWLWAILHTGNKIDLGGVWSLRPYYPLIPWLGVMALGYGFGAVLQRFSAQRSSWMLAIGAVLIASFLLLRGFNSYGDPKPWQVLPNPVFTVLSFLNCHKYPPSLAYLLMTLGPALVLLGLFDRIKTKDLPVLPIFGRTALFYYLLHLYVIHGLALVVAALTDGPVIPLLLGPWSKDMPEHYGYALPVVYGIWLAVLTLLYPLCVWFDRFKRSHSHWAWLKFL